MESAYLVYFVILGGASGSFAGMLSERLHTGSSWISGRSKCNSCARTLGVLDLIPVLSWIFAGGRCRTCTAKIPALYLIVEAVLALSFGFSYTMLGISFSLLVMLLSLTVLAAIVLYDLRHMIVPGELSFLLLLLSILFAVLSSESLFSLGVAFLVSGCIGAGFFLLHLLSSGRAMGLGDAPVALSIALLSGEQAIPAIVFSFWIGSIVGIVILLVRSKGPTMGIEVPFVPFLALGFLLAYFSGWNPFSLVAF